MIQKLLSIKIFSLVILTTMIMCNQNQDQKVTAEIKRLTQQFEEGFNSKDLDKMMEFYADNYIDINQEIPLQTKDERRAYYIRVLENTNYKIKVIPTEIIINRDYAFVRGDIKLIESSNSNIRELRYIEIWKRNNGRWESIWGIDADLKRDQ